jgi:hypothetical protein
MTLILILSLEIVAQTTPEREKQSGMVVPPCPANPDSRYDRINVLSDIAGILNDSIPEYKKIYPSGFGVFRERPRGFFAYDLSDASATLVGSWECVKFVNRHVYHVSPIDVAFSFSHIVILEEGRLKTFKSLNCQNRGDSIGDVISYLKSTLKDDANKSGTIDRVKRCRSFGKYLVVVDDSELRCP